MNQSQLSHPPPQQHPHLVPSVSSQDYRSTNDSGILPSGTHSLLLNSGDSCESEVSASYPLPYSSTRVNRTFAYPQSADSVYTSSQSVCQMVSTDDGDRKPPVGAISTSVSETLSPSQTPIRPLTASSHIPAHITSVQIKSEADTISPPIRSHSVHSLPGNLVVLPSFTVCNSNTSLSSARFSCEKRDITDQNHTPPGDTYPSHLNTYASFRQLTDMHHQTTLMDPLRIDMTASSSSQIPSAFGDHGTLHPSPSHPSLIPQGPNSSGAAAHSTSSGGRCSTARTNPVTPVSYSNSSGIIVASPHGHPFDTSGFLQQTPFPHTSNPNSMVELTANNKNVLANGNGHRMNYSSAAPCDLTSPLIPLGTSPRSNKSRRYSYPYEPVSEIGGPNTVIGTFCKPQYSKLLQLHTSDLGDNGPPVVSPSLLLRNTLPLPESNSNAMMTLCPINDNHRALVTSTSSSRAMDQNLSQISMEHAKSLLGLDPDVPLPGFNSPESAFYQYQHRMEGQRCQVCGELAAGFHHGAYVCEACKKFFMRHSLTDTKPTNICPTGGNCVVAKGSRGKCQICRYRKCLLVGMKMKDPDTQPDVDISNIPCRVCGGRSSGFHFGALTCEGCKGFFRRTEGSSASLVCVGGQNACTITPRSRNACKSCRFRRCIAAGMSKKGSRIGRQPNAVKFHCAIEIRQLRAIQGNSFVGGDPQTLTAGSAGTYHHHRSAYGSLDMGHMLDTPGSVTSLHNRSDIESPKYSPEQLTPTYSNKQDANTVWVNEQKPPLSLLLLFPRASEPIDAMAMNSGHYATTTTNAGETEANNASHRSTPFSPTYSRDRFDRLLTNRSGGVAPNLQLDGSGRVRVSDHQSASEEEDTDDSPVEQHRPSLNTNHIPNAVALGVQSLLGPYGHRLDDKQRTHSSDSNSSTGLDAVQPPSTTLTTVLIANLAKRLAEEEQSGLQPPDEFDDVMNAEPPSTEDILRFTDGMRTATEFLRLPNTYFKTRFRMTSIPLEHRDNGTQVWNYMMNHFHMHAQQIVQFAKLVPGFNQLGITARSNLVRGAMYPVMLLLLSRDYRSDTDEYNYFDFTAEERAVIMHHFPTFQRFTEHLRMAGRLMHHLGLSLPELSLSAAVEILRNHQLLEEPTRSSTRELFLLAHHSLRTCMTGGSDNSSERDERHRWAQLIALNKMLQAMNQEHHEVLTCLKDVRSDLHFPELYIEMFQLADSASALFSVSAQAATFACSSAFQSLAPLKLSLCQSSCETVPSAGSTLYSESADSGATSGESSDLSASTSSGFPLPTGDRWDAGRLALAVPAAVAAVAAAAAAEASHQSHQAHLNHLPLTVASLSRSDMAMSIASSTSSYFTSPSSSFFFPTQPPPS